MDVSVDVVRQEIGFLHDASLRGGGSATLSVTDNCLLSSAVIRHSFWVLAFGSQFYFDQFAKRNENLLKRDLSAGGGFSENCRCGMFNIAHPRGTGANSTTCSSADGCRFLIKCSGDRF
jgi:hypothetical protein